MEKEWEAVRPTGNPPPPRFGHTLVLFDGWGYAFGGYDSLGFCCHEVHALNLTEPEPSWSSFPTTTAWKSGDILLERHHHTSVVFNRSMYVFGGKNSKRFCKENLYELNFDTRQWKVVSTTGKGPSRRYGHCACVVEGSMYIFGGRDEVRSFPTEIYRFEFETRAWKRIELSLSPPGREFAACWVFDGKVFMLGGQSRSGQSCNDLYQLKIRDKEDSDPSSSIRASPPSGSEKRGGGCRPPPRKAYRRVSGDSRGVSSDKVPSPR